MKSSDKPQYRSAKWTVGAVIVIGLLLMATGRLMEQSPNAMVKMLAEWTRDLGLVLGPIGAISFLHHLVFVRDFEAYVTMASRGRSMFSAVYSTDRTDTLREMIRSAKHSLTIAGVAPLREFCHDRYFLLEQCRRLKRIKVATLDPASRHVAMRQEEVNSPDVNIANELKEQGELLRWLGGRLGESLQVISYDTRPPALIFIADENVLLFSWYANEAGENSPCLHIENASESTRALQFLKYLNGTFEQLEQSVRLDATKDTGEILT